MEFDEQKAIDYIRQQLPANSAEEFDDDEILNVIDIMYDYYEENGMCDINADDSDEAELDVDDLMDYVKKVIAKDKNSPLKISDVETIVNAELDYEDSLFE